MTLSPTSAMYCTYMRHMPQPHMWYASSSRCTKYSGTMLRRSHQNWPFFLHQHRFDKHRRASGLDAGSKRDFRQDQEHDEILARGSVDAQKLLESEEVREETAGVPEEPMRVRYETNLRTLREVVPTLRRQMAVDSEIVAYLRYRAEKLSGVLFAFLTHEDAAANTNLAAASKRASSSMKTVAIMTITFLPAAFFAALFAVPSLRWRESDVV
ncbi:hypothetical protein F4776DRAFT_670786 [Hypoxylon sp. NC0597]|nr:hypothetical protein F4776DRAFT_670786 [Hypoxylon sp. NC0597]